MRCIKKIFLVLLIIICLTGCKNLFTYENEKVEYLSGKYNVEMKIKNYGIIEMELDADTAPITVTNFMNLVREKFYDGNKIHRVYKDFVIQGGASSEENKSTIKGEFDANGVSNNISHVRGVVSMARMGDTTTGYDTASTQFFIVLKDSISLDHYYASFGKVTKGMEVADKIASKVTQVDNNGTVVDEDYMPVIEYIKEIEK